MHLMNAVGIEGRQMTDVIRDLVTKQINDALELAAQAVYWSEYVWDDKDAILHAAAERVRALKQPVADEQENPAAVIGEKRGEP